MTEDPLVSVIIPVRDDPAGIRQVLACLSAQTLASHQFEIIIGNDGSRSDLVPQATCKDGRIHLVTSPPLTSYSARNMAVDISKGRVLAFCDADCLPNPQWLEEGLAAMKNADVVAGEVILSAPIKPTIWSLLTVDLFLDQRQNVHFSRAVTANLVVSRKTFDDVGGFDQSLPSGGDYDFVGRSVERGARLKYSPLVVVNHPTIDRPRPFLRKVFATNFWSGARKSRSQEKMDLLGILILVPVLGVAVARRRVLRPAFTLYQERLETSGLKVNFRQHMLAVVALYTLVSMAAGSGRVLGWLRGRRLLRAGKGPCYASGPDSA